MTSAPARASPAASSWSYGGVNAGGSARTTRIRPRRLRGMLVRTWNVFHGNTQPPQRRAFLREMVELITRDEPGVVCLQELPLWSLSRLEAWSGVHAATLVARRSRVESARLGGWLTSINHGLLRSA